MAVRYETTVDLELVTCCKCGMVFGVNALFHRKELKERGGSFFCPSGHEQSYTTSEIAKLKQELAKKEKDLDQTRANLRETKKEVERSERRVSAFKGQVTKTKNKIARGICPCCDVYFENLHQHMTTQHPDYEQADQAEAETGMTLQASS